MWWLCLHSALQNSQNIPRHEFYQTPDTVVVSIFVRNLAEGTTVQYTESSAVVRSNQGVLFELEPLSHPINTEKSRYRISPIKLELTLFKKMPGISWNALMGDKETDATITKSRIVPATPKGPDSENISRYPSSSQRRTNWNKLEQEIEKEEAEDPEQGLNELLSKLYGGASAEQKRAMIKSMQESSGTVLSTNWDEVGKATVKPQPPSVSFF